MQLNIITDNITPDRTPRLELIQQDLAHQGIAAPILVGVRYTTPYFVTHLARLAAEGAPAILVDQCTRLQIKAVQAQLDSPQWQALPEDLVIHLVRQA